MEGEQEREGKGKKGVWGGVCQGKAEYGKVKEGEAGG